MLEAYIYDGLRTPFGRHAGALVARAPRRSAGRRRQGGGGALGLRAGDASTTCRSAAPVQAGEDSRNVARHAPAAGGPAGRDARCRAQPSVRLGAQRAGRRGARHHLRRGRRVRRRRRREHDARAVRGRQGRAGVRQGLQGVRFLARRALPQSEDREPVRRRHHAADGRQPGPRLPAHARGMRSVRAWLAAEVCQGRQGRLLQERDPVRSRSPRPRASPTSSSRDGRASAPRDDHGDACRSSSRCSPTA